MDEDLKRCSSCEIIQVVENFSKDRKCKDGLCPLCKCCRKDYYSKNLDKFKLYNEQNRKRRNIYLKSKRETDINFRLISNTRNRIYKSLKGVRKQSSTKEILGIDIDLYRKWLKFQFTPEMNWSNIEIDHVKPFCVFDVTKDEQLKEAFSWKNTQPLLKQDHQKKGTKFNFLDYQLQFIKAYRFIKLNEERPNQNLY